MKLNNILHTISYIKIKLNTHVSINTYFYTIIVEKNSRKRHLFTCSKDKLYLTT